MCPREQRMGSELAKESGFLARCVHGAGGGLPSSSFKKVPWSKPCAVGFFWGGGGEG